MHRLGREEEAETLLAQARAVRDRYLVKYPQWLKEDKDDEMVVFDQMVCLWAGRFTGKLKQNTSNFEPVSVTAIETPVIKRSTRNIESETRESSEVPILEGMQTLQISS